MKRNHLTWWIPDPLLGTFGLFGSITSAFHKIENVASNVAHNIVDVVRHPTLKTVAAFAVNPVAAPADVALEGSKANPVSTLKLAAAGAGTVYGGSLILGPNLGIVPAAAGTVSTIAGSAGGGTVTGAVSGSTVSDTFITPEAGNLVNTGITDPLSFLTSLGKGFFTGSNPAIAGSGTTASAAIPDNGPVASTGMGWLIAAGVALFVIALVLGKR